MSRLQGVAGESVSGGLGGRRPQPDTKEFSPPAGELASGHRSFARQLDPLDVQNAATRLHGDGVVDGEDGPGDVLTVAGGARGRCASDVERRSP